MRRAAPCLLFLAACGSGLTEDVQAVTARRVEHLVVIVQENHSFDSYFGTWCKAPAGSNPACTKGAGCCEAAPAQDLKGAQPIALTDAENADFSPDHSQACELVEMGSGAMDGFVLSSCGNSENFALAGGAVL